MSEATSQLPRVDRKVIETAREKLSEIAERKCPKWNEGVCRETGESCDFSTCPLVDRIANES